MANQNNDRQEYHLTQSEERMLRRFHLAQNEAIVTGLPRTLVIIFDGRTASFFDGKPAGIDKLTKDSQ